MELVEHPLNNSVIGIGQSSGVRAPGLHASDIYGDFHADLDPKRYRKGGEPPPLLLETGLIFENMLEEGLKRRLATLGETNGSIERPGEFTHNDEFDGRPFAIHYNPDLFIFNGIFRIGEIKATYMSSGLPTEVYSQYLAGDSWANEMVRNVPLDPKYDKYWTQIKMYAWMLQTTYARLYTWFICGGYERPFSPQFLAWDVEFSMDELESNYRMLINHANSKGMLDEGWTRASH